MNSEKLVSGSMVGGFVVSLISGAVNYTPAGLVGASWYGFPATWLYRLVLAPIYNPWRISPAGFVLDFIVWFLVFLVILDIIKTYAR